MMSNDSGGKDDDHTSQTGNEGSTEEARKEGSLTAAQKMDNLGHLRIRAYKDRLRTISRGQPDTRLVSRSVTPVPFLGGQRLLCPTLSNLQ